MFATQQIVGEIEGAEDVERATDDADQRQRVLVEIYRNRHDVSVTDLPLPSTRNESSAAASRSCPFGVSMPSSPNWNVPWWMAILVRAASIW